jgi:hypothetical protein
VDCFRFCIPKFLTKFDAVSLLQALSSWAKQDATHTCYTTSLSGSNRHIPQCCKHCEAARNHTCINNPSTSAPSLPTLLSLLTVGKSIVWYFLERPCIVQYFPPKWIIGFHEVYE